MSFKLGGLYNSRKIKFLSTKKVIFEEEKFPEFSYKFTTIFTQRYTSHLGFFTYNFFQK